MPIDGGDLEPLSSVLSPDPRPEPRPLSAVLRSESGHTTPGGEEQVGCISRSARSCKDSASRGAPHEAGRLVQWMLVITRAKLGMAGQ